MRFPPRGWKSLGAPAGRLEHKGQWYRVEVRPELASLLSYSKIALLHDLLASNVPDADHSEPVCVPVLSTPL